VGFSCDVSPKAFGNAGYSAADVEDYRGAVPDGGKSPALPRDMVPAEIQNSNLRGMMPKDADPSATYVRRTAGSRGSATPRPVTISTPPRKKRRTSSLLETRSTTTEH